MSSATNRAAPVYGLILAGGSSSRMQHDKATLMYGGRSQLDRAYDLVSRHVSKTFVSVRANQTEDPVRAEKPLIVDTISGEGPIVGIRSAFAKFPDVAWLVLACDLPFLSDAVVAQLLASRDPTNLATAYRSAHDGLPEPLCAVWEPAAAAALAAYQAGDGRCPRKFLIRNPVRLLEPLELRALDNVNTPEEYAEAIRALETPLQSKPMQFKIQYYALMREQAGRSEETIESSAATPADLYAELNARYGFSLAREQLKVAVNSEFCDWARALTAGDAVVFIPPVAGG
jgi:molybdopterin-guanine dinucleotide biosynthesis protein A